MSIMVLSEAGSLARRAWQANPRTETDTPGSHSTQPVGWVEALEPIPIILR